MDTSQGWREFFGRWPADLRRRGVLVTSFGEQIPFIGFLVSQSVLLIERGSPDAVGARMVMVPYSEITALKLIEVLGTSDLRPLGFEGELSKK